MHRARPEADGGAGDSGRTATAALRCYRWLVGAGLVYGLLVILLALGSLLALLGRPYGGFFWSWDNTHNLFRVDNFSPAGPDSLQPADFILAVDGQSGPPAALYQRAQARYQAAAGLCDDRPAGDAPVVSYRVLRRGVLLETALPIRCLRATALLRFAAIPLVLALLIWGIGCAVYAVGPLEELNLVFGMATAAASIAVQGANVPQLETAWGRFVALGVMNPCPVLAAAAFYHLTAILPRQHPGVFLRRTRGLWYGALPVALLAAGTLRYVLAERWSAAVRFYEMVAWWGIVGYAALLVLAAVVRCARIYLTSPSRQARSQVRLVGLSMLVALAALPFLAAQQEPHILQRPPISQPLLLFWLVPVYILIAFAVLRFQIFPGRAMGLNVLVGLAVTVIAGMLAAPILALDPEPGFVALLLVLAAMAAFWVLPNPVRRVMRHFALPGTVERDVIERFNNDIQAIYDLELLPAAIVRSLETHLRLRFAALWLEREPGLLVLEAYSERAPALLLPAELPAAAVWQERPGRVGGGPLAGAGCEILLPLRAGQRRIGLLALGERWTEELFDDTDLAALELMADQAALTLGVARQLLALRLVPLQLEQAQLDERERIAQDLHDTTQRELAQLTFALEGVRAQLAEPGAAGALLDACVADLNQAARGLRAILCDLIPAALWNRTLSDLLREQVEHLAARHANLAFELDADPQVEALLGVEARTALLRICQQALDNALRHGRPRSIRLCLGPADGRDWVDFSIADDGCGYAPRPVEQLVEEGHFGLYIMTARALQQGGRLEISSSPGRGTVVRGSLPARPAS